MKFELWEIVVDITKYIAITRNTIARYKVIYEAKYNVTLWGIVKLQDMKSYYDCFSILLLLAWYNCMI